MSVLSLHAGPLGLLGTAANTGLFLHSYSLDGATITETSAPLP